MKTTKQKVGDDFAGKNSCKKLFLQHTRDMALLALDAGYYPARVARLLHVPRQLLHYYIKRWLRKGWIKRDLKTANVTLYRLDPQVKKKLTGGEIFAYKGVRLHAFGLKFPVVEPPTRRVDWKRVRVANWTRLVGCEGGLTVEKTTRHVIVHADEIFSEDPYEATLLAILECLRLARVLEEKFGMKLGAPKLLRKPHYGVYDPMVRWLTEFMEFSDDVGKIDRSEGHPERDGVKPSDVMSTVRRYEKKRLLYVRGYRTHDRQTPFKQGYLITWLDRGKPQEEAIKEAVQRTERALAKNASTTPIIERIHHVRGEVMAATSSKTL